MELRQPDRIPCYQASARERLERLARFVECLLPGQVTFAHWYDQGRGCAVGMAAARDPYFLAQGLRLESSGSLKDCRPSYDERSDWAAVAAFFDLSISEARSLFDRSGYDGDMTPDPSRIAQKIRNHLSMTAAATVAA